jgi:2-C-methyl-D-erythritol 4-phosphate cytidylyltransferase/2-C-methyl-D-erythritol 2,4-cyclodiphosphate synthase
MVSACVALVMAAGSGLRLGGELPKQYRELAGVPMLRRTVQALQACPQITLIQAVIGADQRALYEVAVAGLELPPPAIGGATRQDSVRRGLEALADAAPERVLVHDAARPFVAANLVARVVEALATAEAVLPVVPVVDTLKRLDAGGRVVGEAAREGLARAQTPQGFRFGPLLAAHRRHAGAALTDDAGVVALDGMAVATVMGEEENFKVTTEADLRRAEARLAEQPRRQVCAGGFDVHRLVEGGVLMLCGLRVPHSHGLLGHSDADVALHAITDALLGSIADGDIGSHFPPSDPAWKGASSDRFLQHAAALVRAKGGWIEHVDVTIIGERPKIGPHRDAMRARLAEILALDRDRVSVKATTTEQLGFAGRGEGLAAQAVVSVSLPR